MDQFKDFRGFDFLYDARILTEDGWEFPVHRVLLAMRSEYFCNMFCDSQTEQSDFLVPEIRGSTMEIIMKYIYTGEENFTKNNITDILVTADFLGIEKLANSSRAFAIGNLTISNCISLFQEGSKNKNLSILKASSRFIEMNFEQIIRDKNSKFEDLTSECLEKVLSSDSLYVSGDFEIWKAIELWINKDQEKRKKYLKNLLSYIELNNAQSGFAQEILNHPLLKENQFRIEQFISTRPILPKQRYPKMINFCTKQVWPEDRYVLNNGDVEIFITYDDKIDIWRYIATNSICPNVVLHATGSLFVLFDTNYNRIFTFDIISNTWSNLHSLNVDRRGYCVVKLGNCIYVIGGHSYGRWKTALERYNFNSERWEFAAPHAVDDYITGAAAAIGNKIYIVVLPSYFYRVLIAYVYDSDTDKWQFINAPNIYTHKIALSVYKEQLLVFGRTEDDLNDSMTYVEIYDAFRDTWNDFESIPVTYCYPRTVIIKDVLYVYGDMKYNRSQRPPVFWDETSLKWQVVEASSPFFDLITYEFCTIEDPALISEIRQENTVLDTDG